MSESNNALQFFRPTVRNWSVAPKQTVGAYEHRLHWNENALDYPVDLKEEVLRRFAARPWSHYPDGLRAYDLAERIAAHTHTIPEMVVVGGGSSAMVKAIMEAVLAPGDHMVVPSPTFLLYRRFAGLLGAEFNAVPASPADDYALPVEDLIVSARTNEAKLVALCAPNNPTGTVYSIDEVRQVADECGALLLVDEAYLEFNDQDMRPLLDEFKNVVLVRTFSKAYAMAGLRVGYALASPALAQEIDKLNLSFAISTFSEIAAAVALEESDRFMQQVAEIVAERERMAAAFAQMDGVHVFSSGTNFILIQLDEPTDELVRHLREEYSLLISNMAAYQELVNCLRISVGTSAENDLVLRIVGMYMGNA